MPPGVRLVSDRRCRPVHGDFFAMVGGAGGPDPEQPGRRFHAILPGVDHSPDRVPHPSHASLCRSAGALAEHLRPGGVFALWSDDSPDERFVSVLAEVFAGAEAHAVDFDNRLRREAAANTVHVAGKDTGS